MGTVTVTAENFAETAGGQGITLLDFWATWCPPCRQFAPVFERTSEKHPDITFGKIDTDAEQYLASEFNISSIPTIMAVRDGVVVFQRAGALAERALESLIEQVRGLDMGEVQASARPADSDEDVASQSDAPK